MLPTPSRSVVLYIAGPLTNKVTKLVDPARIEAAKRVAERYIRAGYTVITPHTLYWDFDGMHYEDFMAMDFVLIKRCDIVVMMTNWRESSGATREHTFALDNGITVYYEGKK